MRKPGHRDVVALASVLKELPSHLRRKEIDRVFQGAGSAHLYLIASGQAHPIWGDGSLASAALTLGNPTEPSLNDTDFCLCLALVYEALANYAEAQETHRVTPGSKRNLAIGISEPQSSQVPNSPISIRESAAVSRRR